MNFQGKAVLVYLEEDNIQRAYFRVRPLMTQDGPVGPMEKDFPDEGCLRIVPDRNEQHTFKDRMRSLCGLCVVDLRFFQPDANKIRTNKNYSPMRGEINQFIVYSDAVRALPEDLIYQVVTENECAEAKTPLVFIRSGANPPAGRPGCRRNPAAAAGQRGDLFLAAGRAGPAFLLASRRGRAPRRSARRGGKRACAARAACAGCSRARRARQRLRADPGHGRGGQRKRQ